MGYYYVYGGVPEYGELIKDIQKGDLNANTKTNPEVLSILIQFYTSASIYIKGTFFRQFYLYDRIKMEEIKDRLFKSRINKDRNVYSLNDVIRKYKKLYMKKEREL